MHRSGPLDLDLAAEDITFHDLILAAGNGSDGRNKAGARGGGEARRSRASAAEQRRITSNSTFLG
jgi:hypothetical protein